MNYQRRHSRYQGTSRSRSSDWRYPQLEKGSDKRSRAGIKRGLPEIVKLTDLATCGECYGVCDECPDCLWVGQFYTPPGNQESPLS